MPIYEYICLDCHHKFDILRKMSEADSPLKCENCSGENCSRMISLFFAQSDGRSLSATTSSACGGCSATSCAGCSH